MLGEVATRPATFAALIALLAVPPRLTGGRAATDAEPRPGAPGRAAPDRRTADAARLAFEWVAEPGTGSTGRLLAVTVLGPVEGPDQGRRLASWR